MADKVFDYDEVFGLILSLVEQVSKDESEEYNSTEQLDNYFSRLTKRTLGEYEFARRMAFEGINLVRTAPYPILKERFNQPMPMDFIMYFKEHKCCVDVKYYDKSNLIHEFIIDKSKINASNIFKEKFNLDKAYLAIKRLETWYLIDVKKITDNIELTSGAYKMPFQKLKEWTELKEEHICFNLGKRASASSPFTQPSEGSEYGIFYISWNDNKADNKISFKFSKTEESKNVRDITTLDSKHAKIMRIIYEKILENIRFIIHKNIIVKDIPVLEDFMPSLFTIFDSNKDLKNKNDVLTCIKTLIDAEYIYLDKPYLNYHYGNIWAIEYGHYKEKINAVSK